MASTESERCEKNECCSVRKVLWYVVFCGFATNYMLRSNLTIAIIPMVQRQDHKNVTVFTNTSYDFDNFNGTISTDIEGNLTSIPVSSRKFDWDERQQSTVLGSYFWFYWLTQLPGGILSAKYGTKLVFGTSIFIATVCCFLIPAAASMGHYYLMIVRMIQGLASGTCFPSMHALTARWIPPNERSRFVSAYFGSSIGAAVTYPFCAFIINQWGWEIVFYVCGSLGILWCVAWVLLVYDSPELHPRISTKEKDHILSNLSKGLNKEKGPVPWKEIFTSLIVWTIIFADWGSTWTFATLNTYSPIYFRYIHGWSIQMTGILSGLGHVLRTICSCLGGYLCDYLLTANKLSRTNVRKLATAISTFGVGVFMFALSFSGLNYETATIFVSFSLALQGFCSSGPVACIIDISPNYSSVIYGTITTAVALTGFLTPLIVGYFTFENQTEGQWQKIFWLASFMSVASGILYVIFFKADIQSWNSPTYSKQFQKCKLMNDSTKNNDRKNMKANEYVSVPTNSE